MPVMIYTALDCSIEDTMEKNFFRSGATVAFVNDNVRYGGEVIPVDFLSSSFAEQFGFKVKTIYSLKQQKGNSSQQMAKFGRVALRKGITVWIKE